ncbi:hypothetical protein GCM10017786_38030 [Amycolatopsis deserti]|uniref:Uncharacterized protein n=1 Tax=Amycolatopsis deserti TaxID=185696 RepID=A0ABQ3J3E2_9PSEU|nr:hypothetical protein GCM10017786_38030 [Amycolatopsis deserti]
MTAPERLGRRVPVRSRFSGISGRGGRSPRTGLMVGRAVAEISPSAVVSGPRSGFVQRGPQGGRTAGLPGSVPLALLSAVRARSRSAAAARSVGGGLATAAMVEAPGRG